MKKRIHELKAGDIVHAHGATFRIRSDATESNAHRPKAGHLETAHGPSDCAYTKGEWISGALILNYFGPGCDWLFQGNFNAALLTVAED